MNASVGEGLVGWKYIRKYVQCDAWDGMYYLLQINLLAPELFF